MKNLFLVLVTVLSFEARAAVVKTTIMDVSLPEAGEQDVLVMAEAEGRVLRADANDTALIHALQIAQESGLSVQMNYDLEAGVIKGASLLELDKSIDDEGPFLENQGGNFVPTLFNTYEDAKKLFNRMDDNTKGDSQCYNRAHGWAYDMYRLQATNSMKVFIFFTSKYIRAYDYKWWFHVSPFVMVKNGVSSMEYVMDVSFLNAPVGMQTWTNIFMKNDAVCPVVTKYSSYRQHQYEAYCYLIKTNMFYRSPRDIEYLETQGRQELGWNISEIREARKQAFKNWRNYNP